MNTLDLALKNVVLKKVSGTNGGEWQGPCPACGGDDRFHVWPEQNEGSGAYWCRGCGKTGDNIQYLRDFCGMSFRDACAELRIDIPAGRDYWKTPQGLNYLTNPPPQRTKPEFQPVSHSSPADLWQEKAEKFVTWAEVALAANREALAWLAARGISRETAINYRLGWNYGERSGTHYGKERMDRTHEVVSGTGSAPASGGNETAVDAKPASAGQRLSGGSDCKTRGAVFDIYKDIYRARKAWGLPEILKDDGRPKVLWIPRGLVIPYIIDGIILRIRIRRPEGEPRYYVLPGSSMSTMLLERERRAFVVVESELDAIAVAAGNALAGAVALGSVSAKPDAETFAVLQGALSILNALDYDAAGAKAMDWWKEQFARCDRWPVPAGKDPGEAVRLGIDLSNWIEKGLPPALTIASPVVEKTGANERGRRAKPGDILADGDKTPAPSSIMKQDDPCATSEGGAGSPLSGGGSVAQGSNLSPPLRELYLLLRNNPGVKIFNTPTRFTVLRNGKYVGGRINKLVFEMPEVLDYIFAHPAEEIDGGNFVV